MSKREIWVAGYPSVLGGADTELDHNIDLWRSYDVEVNLVPTFGAPPNMRDLCDRRGCKTHVYHPAIFKDRVVVSYCNGKFLELLPQIMESGRPALVVWFNCMTCPTTPELQAHSNGWIDLFGFVSNYQRNILKPLFERIGPVEELEGYQPYFNPGNAMQSLVFDPQKSKEYFGIGRVSRNDARKYPEDMWQTFSKVLAPVPTHSFILGYGNRAREKTGSPPEGLKHTTWEPNTINVRDLYSKIHCLIHKTGGSRESYCRVIQECYASGVPVIVERDFAFPELIEDGVTGFMCNTSDEMAFRASQLAFDEDKRQKIIEAARLHQLGHAANRQKSWAGWREIFGHESLSLEITSPTGLRTTRRIGETANADNIYDESYPPQIGVVIGTYGSTPYVHLGLEALKRNCPDIPVLVHDDGSKESSRLRELCYEYGATFETNSRRLGHTLGDLSVFHGGLGWASTQGLDILVKFSRRFIPLEDWRPGLLQTAYATQYPTYSNECVNLNWKFRSECVAMHVPSWNKAGAVEMIREVMLGDEPIPVEPFLGSLSKGVPVCRLNKLHQQEVSDPHGKWDLLGNNKTIPKQDILWWNANTQTNYFELSQTWGLPYSLEDFLRIEKEPKRLL